MPSGLRAIGREFRTQRLFIIIWTQILFYASFALPLPTLPLYLSEFRAGMTEIGLIIGIFAVGVLGSRPYVGRYVDRLGARYVLWYAGGFAMVASALYVFAPSLPWMYPIRIIHGVSLAIHSTALSAIVSASTNPGNRGTILGIFDGSSALILGIGAVLGSSILDAWGHTAVFMVAALFGFAAMGLAWCGKQRATADLSESRAGLVEVLTNRTLLLCSAAMFLLILVHGGIIAFLPIHFAHRMPGNVGVFYLLGYSVSTLVQIVAGQISDKECRIPVMLTSLVLLGLGVFGIGRIWGTLSFVVSSILYGAGFFGFQVAIGAFVGDLTNDTNRGRVFSSFYSSFDLGIALSGVVMGMLAHGVGIEGMFTISSMFTIPAILLLLYAPSGGPKEAFACGWLGGDRPRFYQVGGVG